VLVVVRGITKPDAVTLLSTFGSVGTVLRADMEHLLLCPGVGERKVKRLLETFRSPFLHVKRGGSSKTLADFLHSQSADGDIGGAKLRIQFDPDRGLSRAQEDGDWEDVEERP